MNPVIGITSVQDEEGNIYTEKNIWLSLDYVRCIEGVGALPLVIPVLREKENYEHLLTMIDALVISGGHDLDPMYYQEEPHPDLGEIEPDRDKMEIALVQAALMIDLPILGICRGQQVLAVAAGGKLYQDIYKQEAATVKHYQKAPMWYTSHGITIEKDTLLSGVLRETETRVNSFHHQAIKKVPHGFRVSAYASDGIIEAIESTKHQFALGVQWHPESLSLNNVTTRLLFEATREAAITARERRERQNILR